MARAEHPALWQALKELYRTLRNNMEYWSSNTGVKALISCVLAFDIHLYYCCFLAICWEIWPGEKKKLFYRFCVPNCCILVVSTREIRSSSSVIFWVLTFTGLSLNVFSGGAGRGS